MVTCLIEGSQMTERFCQDEICRIHRETGAPGAQIQEVCRRHKITEQTFFRWRRRFGVRCAGREEAEIARGLGHEAQKNSGRADACDRGAEGVQRKKTSGRCRIEAGSVGARGVPLPRIQSPSDTLRAETAGQGQGGGRSAARDFPAAAALWLPQNGGVARCESVPAHAHVEPAQAAAAGATAT